MVGYAENHSNNSYHMYNPATNLIIITRDVVWSEWSPVDPKSAINKIREQHASPDLTPGIELDSTAPSLNPHVFPDNDDSSPPVNTFAGRNGMQNQTGVQTPTAGRNGNTAMIIGLRDDDKDKKWKYG